MCQLIICLLPGIYNLFVTLLLSDQTTLIVLCNQVYCILSLFDHLWLLRRHSHIRNRYCHGCSCRELIAHCFNGVKYLCSLCCPMCIDNFFKDLLQLLLTNKEIYLKDKFISRNASVNKSKILRKDLIKEETSQCGMYITGDHCTIRHLFATTYSNLGLQLDCFILISKDCFVYTLEVFVFANASRSFLCQVVNTKDHILRRYSHRTTIGRLQKVVR